MSPNMSEQIYNEVPNKEALSYEVTFRLEKAETKTLSLFTCSHQQSDFMMTWSKRTAGLLSHSCNIYCTDYQLLRKSPVWVHRVFTNIPERYFFTRTDRLSTFHCEAADVLGQTCSHIHSFGFLNEKEQRGKYQFQARLFFTANYHLQISTCYVNRKPTVSSEERAGLCNQSDCQTRKHARP